MAQKFSIAARSALMANITNVATSLTVDIALCDLFPVADTGTDPVPTVGKDYFKVVLEDSSHNIEIVYVRTRASGSASMTNLLRGQEGTTARAYLAGSIVGLRHTAVDLADAVSFATGASSFWRTLVGWTTAALSRVALGATTVGDAVFTAANQAAGRTALGLGTAATGNIGSDVQAFNANNAVLNAAQAFSAAQRGTVSALTDGATITPDFAAANNFSVTLGGSRTLANPSNLVVGQSGAIVITQDGTGFRTLAFGSNWKFSGGVAPTLTTTAAAIDVLVYYVDAASRITARLLNDVK